MTYQELDAILKEVEDLYSDGKTPDVDTMDKIRAAYGEEKVRRVVQLLTSTEHKRHMPPSFKVQ